MGLWKKDLGRILHGSKVVGDQIAGDEAGVLETILKGPKFKPPKVIMSNASMHGNILLGIHVKNELPISVESYDKIQRR